MTYSLKTALRNAIKCYDGKIYPYNEMVRCCALCKHRVSNGERRLRELTHEGEIETIYDPDKHYIIGYRFKKVEQNGQVLFI